MVMKKTLIVSLAISFILLSSAHLYNAERFNNTNGITGASVGLNSGNQEIVSFALGNLIVYLVLTGVIYLFFRSILKSFSGPKTFE